MPRLGFFAALFLFLLVVFVLGYRIAADSPALGILVFLGGVFAAFYVLFRKSARGAHTNNHGLTLLSEGRLVEALAAFEEAQKDMGRNPLPRFNAGSGALRTSHKLSSSARLRGRQDGTSAFVRTPQQ